MYERCNLVCVKKPEGAAEQNGAGSRFTHHLKCADKLIWSADRKARQLKPQRLCRSFDSLRLLAVRRIRVRQDRNPL
jgi:hypothetical protein